MSFAILQSNLKRYAQSDLSAAALIDEHNRKKERHMQHGRADYDGRIQDKAVPTKKAAAAAEEDGMDLPSHIGEDEPVFLMRAQDTGSVPGVQGYVKWLRLNNGDPAAIRSAEKQLAAMQAWQEANPKALHRPSL